MSKGAAFAEWLDSRMPTLKREWNRHMAEYYAPKELQLLVLLRRAVDGGAGDSAR